jgi:AraC family ethanolamine operon transcriptional activator
MLQRDHGRLTCLVDGVAGAAYHRRPLTPARGAPVNARLPISASSPPIPERPEALRTYSLQVRHTHDADEQAESLRRWNQTYDQISAGTFAGRTIDAWFDDIQLFRETTNQSVHQRGNPWRDSVAMAVPLAMDGDGHAHGLPMTADMIYALDARVHELDLVAPKVFDVAAVALNADTVARFCRDVEGIELADLMRGDWLIRCGPECMARLRQFLCATFAVLESGQMPLAQAAIRRNLRDGVLTNLFATLGCGNNTADTDGTAGQRRVVDRARGYLLSRPDEPVTIAELCRAIGVSRRKLQYCFQESIGCTPLHYLRALRLNRVRRELKRHDAPVDSVQDVAARWGFWHLSHFAADYRHMFGELPSDTLRRRRSRPPTGRRHSPG